MMEAIPLLLGVQVGKLSVNKRAELVDQAAACVVGVKGILVPILEEVVFGGFFMASLTKWVPNPMAVIISAFVFAIAHVNSVQFSQTFALGIGCGLSFELHKACAVTGVKRFRSISSNTGRCTCFMELVRHFASHLSSRNLLTPVAAHALWNSLGILLLTFLHQL